MHTVAYEIDNNEIIPIYDVPHLTKCLRNNLTKDLEFIMNGKKLQASWDHIIELFNIDKTNENYEIRALPKLTEAHVYPYKQKMKVCLATQVFNQRVSSIMKLLSRPMFQNNKLKGSDGTADLLLFVDKTFDSLNASRSIPDVCKPLLGAILIESENVHLNHWNQAIAVFQSMKFIDKNTKKPLARQPPCINNWVMTLKSFKYLWYKLKNNYKFKFLLTRNINQDSLEIFFGNVRSHSYRNTNPDCYHFVSSFKTLLINNFSSIKLIGNCELDESDNVLNNLKQFIIGSPSDYQKSNANDDSLFTFPITDGNGKKCTMVTDMNVGYIAGYMARTILKYNNNCKLCKDFLVSKEKTNLLIKSRDYTSSSLIHPNSTYFKIIKQMFDHSDSILPTIMENGIGK